MEQPKQTDSPTSMSTSTSTSTDIQAGSQAINYSSSGNFTRLDMSTGGKLSGIATFSRPMTVMHEG